MTNNNNLINFAMNIILNSPNIRNNPQAQEMINVIKNNDSVRGQQIAENLCKTYGISTQEALNQAKRKFGMPF